MQRISPGYVIAFDSRHKGNIDILAQLTHEVEARLLQTWQVICAMTNEVTHAHYHYVRTITRSLLNTDYRGGVWRNSLRPRKIVDRVKSQVGCIPWRGLVFSVVCPLYTGGVCRRTLVNDSKHNREKQASLFAPCLRLPP